MNAHRATDLAAFSIQSVQNEVPTQSRSWLRHQADFVFFVVVFPLLVPPPPLFVIYQVHRCEAFIRITCIHPLQ